MNIYSTLQIGEYHLLHCEDHLITEKIGPHQLLCAVMDGCTMAVESHFASTLTGKLLRKIAKTHGYKALYEPAFVPQPPEAKLAAILRELFTDLRALKNQLLLDQKELLTTLILLVIDTSAQAGSLLVIGDGVVNVNGTITEFDQDNKPDYLGFHLHEDFDQWYGKQQQKISFNGVKNIGIATDGIVSFTKVALKDAEEISPLHFLLEDEKHAGHEDMLALKLKELEHVYGLKPGDDLALIRVTGE